VEFLGRDRRDQVGVGPRLEAGEHVGGRGGRVGGGQDHDGAVRVGGAQPPAQGQAIGRG
jgi:hypothetical protein